MSFRKRSEVISNPRVPGRGPTPLVGRVPTANTGRSPVAVPGRGPAIQGRGPPVAALGRPDSHEVQEINNPSLRPSVITSQPTISTGTPDLDKLLAHQGLPLGNSLLIEESGTTDFASILLRVFASQGIMHDRIEGSKDANCHIIVLGLSPDWSKDLPGLYKGSSKEKKKALIQSNESKISVSNLAQAQSAASNRDLKIAWRYGLNDKKQEGETQSELNEHYNYQFDITEKLKPLPNNQEISFVKLTQDYIQIIQSISSIINQQLKKNPNKIIRLIIPNLLIPSLYSPQHSQATFMVPFFHGLRALLKSHTNNLSIMISLPIDLYPRTSTLVSLLETLSDSVIHLQPFNQEMAQFIEKAYKNEPSKIQHGLVNILKLPILTERGLMTIHNGEYAFKNGRKKFEIEEWGIPVEDDAQDSNNPSALEPQQTTKSIDF